jgi:hypothetical protein
MSERGRSQREQEQPIIVFNEPSSSSAQHTADRTGESVEEFPSELESSASSAQRFGFLYSKESDKIGAMVSKQGMNLRSEAPTAAACARRRALKIAQMTADANPKLVQPMPDHNLSCYQHGAKVENPRYATTSNEYGKSILSNAWKFEDIEVILTDIYSLLPSRKTGTDNSNHSV